MLVICPMYHSSACAGSTMSMLNSGCELVMPAPHFDPVMALKAMESKKISTLIGVPTMFLGNVKMDSSYKWSLLTAGLDSKF